ncbi:polyprenol phosphomannose-dependent alpha 1,6 mannosyltransferase MptB [Nesterenkonia aerolata]|uniref:Polyprenol phosphomannose-dependent alpha 1,6 mannosyltransferase MptB n=1 Tax=Nesterenkonia aerolata TaxID=3074079 RepID=A0ABU2DQG7_9MICC|nr:polyprenol phosphomannose-dependent alpha 1,6 mannosyltransferase MptB [Nesterenkonia sp. LY-0111]MDR8018704.1 polyprenol phosphomannose-dependent alpha 1,6 mannosyltransferase MptB [Nesterenkonia sp. LY-0111]
MRDSRLTRAASGLRDLLGRFPGTSWLIGGEEAEASHTLRQGMLGSLLIMVGSWGVGWLATTPGSVLVVNPLLLPLRTTTAGVVTCIVLLALGSLLLVRSWLRISQRLGGWGPHAVPVLRRALVMWGAPLLFTVPIFSRDVYSYIAQGRALHAGLNPYETGISELPGWFAEGADGLWAESPSPYGPLFLALARLIWFSSDDVPEAAVVLFRLLSLLGVVLMVVFIPRLAEGLGSDASWALWLCLLNPLSLLVFIAAAHNDALMIGLMVAGCWAMLTQRRWWGAGLLLGAVTIKPIALVVVPFAVLLLLSDTSSRRARLRQWLWIGVIAVLVLGVLGLSLRVGFGWIPAALGAGSAALPAAPVGLLGLGLGEAAAAVTAVDADTVAAVFFAVVRLFSGVVVAWLLLRPRLGNPVLWAGYGLAVVVVLSSVLQPWYLLWLLPLFAVVHVYRGRILVLVSLLITLLVVGVIVLQVSVAQWIDATTVQLIGVGVGLAYLVYLLFFDPNTAELFDISRRSERWNRSEGWARLRELSSPAVSWRRPQRHCEPGGRGGEDADGPAQSVGEGDR